MEYRLLYLVVLNVLGIFAINLFWNSKRSNTNLTVHIRKNRFEKIVDQLRRGIDEDEVTKIFVQAGWKLTALQYQAIRYFLFVIWMFLTYVLFWIKHEIYPLNQVIFGAFIFIISSPTLTFGGKKTPFNYVLDFFIKRNKKKKNMEIYRTIAQFKNMIITNKDNPIGSDFILEQLRKFTNVIRPEFNKMIFLWSMGKKEEGCDYFANAIGTKEAFELASFFRKLDQLNPYELNNQIVLLQEVIKRERETTRLKSDENISNLIYLLVVITNMVVMINFVIIVYYLEFIQLMRFF
ncbi:hypothetical protein [Vulcanibacillus modesticaldus]|uniref:hypothetical protein n=1 Tax=Vulcanibacillus modesticaldus TaxID=337097 RepID=UPI00114CC574|nr:hypothetical protein [Vulcanibacillus modesticaldus]